MAYKTNQLRNRQATQTTSQMLENMQERNLCLQGMVGLILWYNYKQTAGYIPGGGGGGT